MGDRARSSSLGFLPIPPTRLIGRRTERAAARAQLLDEGASLLTLTGPGGVGKTRLALAIAADVADHFADGIAWVDLAPLADPAMVAATIAGAIGLVLTPSSPVADDLLRHLRSRQCLLLLDNCEHVLPATADLVGRLLGQSLALQVLATSRAPLRLRGEQVLPVEPLPLPPPTALTFETLAEAEAVRLFVERARSVRPAFRLEEAKAPTVAALCRELDGLPLAIELAAARISVLSPEALLARMSDRLRVLGGGARDLSARQQTMRATIAWSHDLLDNEPQDLFRRLAVFAGGFTLEASHAVAGAALGPRSDAVDVANGLTAIVDQSLVRPVEAPDGDAEPRYAMLETIREFGLERLAASGEEAETRQRHAAHYLALVERWSPDPALPGEKRRLAAITPEYDNVRLALAWFDEHDDADGLPRLTGALFEFWHARGLYSEGRRWLRRALERSERAEPSVRLRALMTASALARYQGDLAEATLLDEEALPLARRLGNPGQFITALLNSGLLAYFQGRHAAAETLLTEAHNLARGFGADVPAALPVTGVVLNNLASIAFAQGNLDRAAALFEEAILLLRASDYGWALDHALAGLGGVRYCQGDALRAAPLFAEALALAWSVPDPRKVASALLGAVGVAATRGRPDVGARLLGAAEAVCGSVGAPFTPTDRLVYGRSLAALTAALGETRVAAARAAGRSLPIEAAVAEAGAVVRADAAEIGAIRAHAGVGLTGREVEVLRLVAAGRTDQEIADALFLSRRTVNGHVAHLLAKLEVHTRREAVERGHELGVLTSDDPPGGYT